MSCETKSTRGRGRGRGIKPYNPGMTSSDDAVRLPVEPGILPQTSRLVTGDRSKTTSPGLSLRSSALECGNPSPDDQASTSTSDDMVLASEISKINLNPSLPTENCRDENAEQKMNEHRIGTKHGTSGVVVSLRANYIKLEETKLQSLVEYRLDIVPPVDSRAMRMKIWRGVRGSLGPNYKLYDGGNKVITLTELELNSDAKRELHATVNETIHKVVIKQTRVIPKGSIDALAIYGVLLKRSMQSVNLQPVGSAKDNQFIDKSRLRAFEQHMTEMAPGFINVVQQREDALMLRIFPFHKFFRTDTCYDQMVRIKGTLKDEEEHHFEQRVRTLLCGNVVMTRYNHKTYRVDDVDFTKNPTSVWNEETRETYVGYYKRKYDLEIKNLTQPLLISRAKARDRRRGVEFLRLIPEVCNMTGISEQMKKDFRTMHDVSSTLKRNPEQMRKEVRDLLEKLRENPSVQEDFKTFNLKIDADLMKLEGRKLDAHPVVGAESRVVVQRNGDWGVGLRDSKLYRTVDLKNWCLIFLRSDDSVARNFAENLQRAARGFGGSVKPPTLKSVVDSRASSFLEAVDRTLDLQFDLITVIVPDSQADRYNAIKRRLCVDNAIPSQVIQRKTLQNSRALLSVCSKLFIQMNTKMGGAPWRIRVPLQGLMVAGFDVNHDVAMQNRSVGALVCSLDEQMTKFTSNVAFHENHSELGTNMEALFVSALKSYHKNNSAYPRRILFYRDGVGEGDVEPVRQLEIAGVLKAIEKLCPETRLKVVSVNKRIQTQFFREGPPGRAAAAMNPEPGTVIDDVVTNPEWVDFYLIPQSVREGTVNPVSYRTLHDDPRGFGFTSDQLQIITYVLCHAYFNWTGTVRVPAPCQYAHKLAFLTGQSLRRVHHRALSDKLFYL